MEQLINLFILLPLVGFVLSLVIPRQNENLLSWVSFTTVGIQFFAALIFIVVWMFYGGNVIDLKEFSIFQAQGYDFYIDFYFDRITLTYLIIGAMLTFIITVYSRYYLHREEGYKRFFNIILFFYLGYNIVIFSGNLETLFIGWEILGVSSFLLIAFYRDRYLPVKNAVKVFSIYRIGDVGLILAMWLSHHLWHENISFYKLSNYELVHEHLAEHSMIGFAISFLIFISAAAKSAQLPFSSWLPRAMEGPTPSSAIFYGSLSVHIGAFILMRTYPFWEFQTSFRIFVVIAGLTTAILATFTSRVQSSIKSQIAYSSIAQIGLIFIEIALGLEAIALVHVAGNAFLRTYQLLVSPSVVSYKIREQFYNYVPRPKTIEDSWPKRFEYSLYIISLKEWNLDSLMYKYMWNPLKRLGSKWGFFTFKNFYFFFGIGFLAGLILSLNPQIISPKWAFYLPLIFSFLGLLMVVKSFTERNSVRLSWTLIITNHLTIALAISFNEHFDMSHHIWYLSGVLISGIVGYFCIQRLRGLEKWVSLDKFYGHAYEHPKIALVFLIACLAIAGFPITPTFIGEDLIFSHIKENQVLLAFFIAMSLIINGLAAIRIYARIFLGPHVKTYHGSAKRSS
jgi:NADH-quinone oxidoreductase subunit L